MLKSATFRTIRSKCCKSVRYNKRSIMITIICFLFCTQSATDKQIKKAYTVLSMRWHPDKNEDKELANAKFLEIQRAYKALTDEVSRKNWEEYGNPDGPRGFSLGIALPAWLVGSAGNKAAVLLAYAIAFGIILPWIVAKRWNRSRTFTRDRIRHTTMEIFFRELRQDSTPHRLFEILCLAAEFGDLPLKGPPSAYEQLYGDMSRSGYDHPKSCSTGTPAKVHMMLHAHFHRVSLGGDDTLRLDQAMVVATSMQMVLGMLQIALARDWFVCARHCMTLSQFLVQAVWSDGSNAPTPFLQLPHLDTATIKHFSSGKKNIRAIPDLLAMKEDERRSLLRNLDDDQYSAVLCVAQAIPVVTIEAVDFKGMRMRTQFLPSSSYSARTRRNPPGQHCHVPDSLASQQCRPAHSLCRAATTRQQRGRRRGRCIRVRRRRKPDRTRPDQQSASSGSGAAR